MPLKTTGLQINEALFFSSSAHPRPPQKKFPPEPTHRLRTGHKTEQMPLSSLFLEKETLSIGTASCSCIVMCFIVPERKIYLYENEQNLKFTHLFLPAQMLLAHVTGRLNYGRIN